MQYEKIALIICIYWAAPQCAKPRSARTWILITHMINVSHHCVRCMKYWLVLNFYIHINLFNWGYNSMMDFYLSRASCLCFSLFRCQLCPPPNFHHHCLDSPRDSHTFSKGKKVWRVGNFSRINRCHCGIIGPPPHFEICSIECYYYCSCWDLIRNQMSLP